MRSSFVALLLALSVPAYAAPPPMARHGVPALRDRRGHWCACAVN